MQIVGLDDVISAIDRAKSVKINAFVLGRGEMFRALEHAADRGANVSVDLSDAIDGNEQTAKTLREHGVGVVTTHSTGADSIHAKVALVDYRVFYDDRNFRSADGSDLIVETDIDDALPLRSKADVIADEASLLRSAAGHRVLVSTESFGPGPVADALLERARRGDDVRLVYNSSEMTRGREATLTALRSAGVRIEESDGNHKLACVGDRVWVGSANATVTGGETGLGLEWGTELSGVPAARVQARAEQLWHEANSSVHGNLGARR